MNKKITEGVFARKFYLYILGLVITVAILISSFAQNEFFKNVTELFAQNLQDSMSEMEVEYVQELLKANVTSLLGKVLGIIIAKNLMNLVSVNINLRLIL